MEANIGAEQRLAMFLYVAADLAKLGRTKSEVGGEGDGLEPELRFKIVARDMDVRRLVVFPAVKMKPVGSNPEYGGHGNDQFDRCRGCRVQAG